LWVVFALFVFEATGTRRESGWQAGGHWALGGAEVLFWNLRPLEHRMHFIGMNNKIPGGYLASDATHDIIMSILRVARTGIHGQSGALVLVIYSLDIILLIAYI
jgi:hypothetical protein